MYWMAWLKMQDGLYVTFSKTENLLQTVTEGATFSQEREETIDGLETREGFTTVLPVVEV